MTPYLKGVDKIRGTVETRAFYLKPIQNGGLNFNELPFCTELG